MSLVWTIAICGALCAMTDFSYAGSAPEKSAAEAKTAPSVRYKKGKDIDFEALVIQGQLKRPEITVVTGDGGQGSDGLLRLRENFLDRMAGDFGEEAK